jgi:hypothetical protein
MGGDDPATWTERVQVYDISEAFLAVMIAANGKHVGREREIRCVRVEADPENARVEADVSLLHAMMQVMTRDTGGDKEEA